MTSLNIISFVVFFFAFLLFSLLLGIIISIIVQHFSHNRTVVPRHLVYISDALYKNGISLFSANLSKGRMDDLSEFVQLTYSYKNKIVDSVMNCGSPLVQSFDELPISVREARLFFCVMIADCNLRDIDSTVIKYYYHISFGTFIEKDRRFLSNTIYGIISAEIHIKQNWTVDVAQRIVACSKQTDITKELIQKSKRENIEFFNNFFNL